MTVQTNTNIASFNGNGVTQIFPIAFKFNNDTDLVVLLVDDATGAVSQLTLNSDYTVSGEGDEEGGLINVVVAPASGQRLKVTRVVDILQLTDLRNQGKFFAEVHEDAFDLLTMIAQQHESGIKSALRVAESDPEPARIPSAAQRAGKILSFDTEGNPQVVAPVTDSSTELRIELANDTPYLVDGEVVGGVILPIKSIAALRARAGRYDGDVAYLRGRTESSTLGAGQFKWDAASTLADDDGVVIGSAATGRWIRIGTNFECHGEWFGVGNDGGDYTAELQNAINYAATAVGGAQGMRVQLLRGKVGLSNKITLPNRVALHGANGRGTVIEALDTFEPTATEMFHAHNGTSSMFGSRLVDLFIDMRGKGDVNGRCIYSQAWQETCGMERVCLIGFPKYGLEYSDGYGGAAYLPLKDIEIFGGASGTTPTAGIKINQVSTVGGFVLSIDGATITGATSAQCPVGISMTNDTLVARGLHFEYVDNGVTGAGIGGISIDTITGSSNNVGTLVTLGSAWTGQLNIRDSITNGATNHVKNNANGAVIPSGAGMQPEITYPDKAQSAALGYVVFDASATAVDEQCTIVSKSANIKGVLKTAVGKFTVQWLYTMPNKQRSVGGGITNLNNTDPIKVTHTGSTGSSEVVQVRRKTDDTTWNDYDPQRLSLQFFGDRL
ncbi:hypothetical protein ACX1DW_01695 [Stutzerimonas sp. KH-1]|jgi:hypothetical protein